MEKMARMAKPAWLAFGPIGLMRHVSLSGRGRGESLYNGFRIFNQDDVSGGGVVPIPCSMAGESTQP